MLLLQLSFLHTARVHLLEHRLKVLSTKPKQTRTYSSHKVFDQKKKKESLLHTIRANSMNYIKPHTLPQVDMHAYVHYISCTHAIAMWEAVCALNTNCESRQKGKEMGCHQHQQKELTQISFQACHNVPSSPKTFEIQQTVCCCFFLVFLNFKGFTMWQDMTTVTKNAPTDQWIKRKSWGKGSYNRFYTRCFCIVLGALRFMHLLCDYTQPNRCLRHK